MNIKMSAKRARAITLMETLVVILVLVILFSMIDIPNRQAFQKAKRISCANNLKQIGVGYRIWGNDHGADPIQKMQGILTNSFKAGPFAYLPYSIMQNELGQSPKIVVCPSDERAPNTNFYYGSGNAPAGVEFKSTNVGTFDNTNVSYFCRVGAIDSSPASILGGDRNLGDGGVINPTTGEVLTPQQDPGYGISGTTANPGHPCGADAVVSTSGMWMSSFVSGGGGRVGNGSQAVGWSAKMHSAGNIAGAGNIMLGDGSAQQCTTAGLRRSWLANATNSGNFYRNDLIHTGSNSIRLLFP